MDAPNHIHCLDLRFASTRLQSPQMVNAMMHSIEQSGQLTPVAAIGGEKKRLILMDGYLRLAALRRMGSDTVCVTLWDCDEASGLGEKGDSFTFSGFRLRRGRK